MGRGNLSGDSVLKHLKNILTPLPHPFKVISGPPRDLLMKIGIYSQHFLCIQIPGIW